MEYIPQWELTRNPVLSDLNTSETSKLDWMYFEHDKNG